MHPNKVQVTEYSFLGELILLRHFYWSKAMIHKSVDFDTQTKDDSTSWDLSFNFFFSLCFLEGLSQKKTWKSPDSLVFFLNFGWDLVSPHMPCHHSSAHMIRTEEQSCGEQTETQWLPFSLSPGPVCSDLAGPPESSSSSVLLSLLSPQPLPFSVRHKKKRCYLSAWLEAALTTRKKPHYKTNMS